MYSSNSPRNFVIAFFTGQAAPSARPQIVVPGMMPIEFGDFDEQVEIFQLAVAGCGCAAESSSSKPFLRGTACTGRTIRAT